MILDDSFVNKFPCPGCGREIDPFKDDEFHVNYESYDSSCPHCGDDFDFEFTKIIFFG